MPLAHAKNCVYCGGDEFVPYRHWRLCVTCSAGFIARLAPPTPKPELLNKGVPTRR